MKIISRWIVVSVLFGMTVGCIMAPTQATDEGTPLVFETDKRLTILYTDDEHGWIAGEGAGRGAANLMGVWKEVEGYEQGGGFLVLSGGDNWTGPAISTWFEGESTVEVMNAMGYDASAVGNHEFDFSLDVLTDRAADAEFPYLGANIVWRDTEETPTEVGILPYVVLDVSGVQVGVIGLTTTQVPGLTNPTITGDLLFLDYEPVVRHYVPMARGEGAEIIAVITHICSNELRSLARETQDLDIAFLGGGHCHETFSEKIGESVVAAAGYNFSGYAYARYTLTREGEVMVDGYGTRENEGGTPDDAIAAIVDSWQKKADAELNLEIGFLENDVPRRSQAMQDLVTESWLSGYPTADIAITNLGGLRADLTAGPVTLADIVSVLPFDNTLVEVRLTGSELKQILSDRGLAAGGVYFSRGSWILKSTGLPLDDDREYLVLINDFMYVNTDDYSNFARFDPEGYFTGIDWRNPVIAWVGAQNSTPEDPLDLAISALANQ